MTNNSLVAEVTFKVSLIFATGAYYVSCQKNTFKNKIWLWGIILNVDLGLFYPNNQLMFSFVAS